MDLPVIDQVKAFVVQEELPLSWVHYPIAAGGIFPGFSAHRQSKVFLCECTRGAVDSYLEFEKRWRREDGGLKAVGDPTARLPNAPLPSSIFAPEIAEASLADRDTPLSQVTFCRGLCHRCNMEPPRMLVSPVGRVFEQRFGWYIQQTYLRNGINPNYWEQYNPEKCPEEVRSLLVSANYLTRELAQGWQQAKNALRKRMENETRAEFGLRNLEDRFLNESLLFQIVSGVLPNREIQRQIRPDWLDGLELDIFVPAEGLGIEYQGQQHFMPIGAWGGEAELRVTQERDRRKAELCKQLGLLLVHVDYQEPLTAAHVRVRLRDAGVDV
jgi:hypothetical protein